MSKYDELKALYEKEDKLELFEKKVHETCLVVMRQTDYSEEKALEKLKDKLNIQIDDMYNHRFHDLEIYTMNTADGYEIYCMRNSRFENHCKFSYRF